MKCRYRKHNIDLPRFGDCIEQECTHWDKVNECCDDLSKTKELKGIREELYNIWKELNSLGGNPCGATERTDEP